MHADTDDVRTLAATTSAHADQLGTIAAKLAAVPTSAAAFGPVGQPFLAALADAVADGARTAASLRDVASASGETAYRTALAYDDADDRAGARVLGL
ncbi:type VII secretion target [Mycolicibacterium celeriflavum]|uniref:type VII secretion target n=1 Tax=Mycolicibacterium celeriflavum TaxID=1249101 RepID=UPI003CEF0F40